MTRRILVPIDGSGTAAQGLTQALSLAAELKTPPHFVLLHLVERPSSLPEAGFGYDPELIAQAMKEEGQALLTRTRARCEEAGFTAETELRDADQRIADIVVERARTRECDLIVMGTHGRRGASRWVMGSDAEAVVRSSPVPVLLVREPGA